MRPKQLNITPAIANDWLEATQKAIEAGKLRQRSVSQAIVDRYANDIRNSNWITSHQGIAISESGWVLDGRHRLYAIKQANRSVDMIVTFDLPDPKLLSNRVTLMDVIDCGKVRSTANQLQISHGIANATTVAVLANGLMQFSLGTTHLRATTSNILDIVTRVYPNEIEYVTRLMAGSNTKKLFSWVGIPVMVYMSAYPNKARQFLNDFITMENLSADSPVLALLKYAQRTTLSRQVKEERFRLMSVTANAIKAYHLGEAFVDLRSSKEARVWLLNQAKNQTNAIRNIFRAEGQKLEMQQLQGKA